MSRDGASLVRTWVCGVFRSGYHNGATCKESDPHDGWGCGWRLETSFPDDGKTYVVREVQTKEETVPELDLSATDKEPEVPAEPAVKPNLVRLVKPKLISYEQIVGQRVEVNAWVGPSPSGRTYRNGGIVTGCDGTVLQLETWNIPLRLIVWIEVQTMVRVALYDPKDLWTNE